MIFILLFCFGFGLFAQQSNDIKINDETRIAPAVKTIFVRLGDKALPVKIQQYGEANNLVFINLHDDEITAVESTKRILEKEGGMLIEVENDLKREIRFSLGPALYTFDPNRMFSRQGIIKSLEENGKISKKAIDEVEKFAERILQLFPEKPSCVIALHNNTPGMFSVTSYSPGNKKMYDAAKVYINPGEDTDNFFLTTNAILYERLANKKYNTVLQDNTRCKEDGSLSVYCGKKNIRYVNLETEHGQYGKYTEMMQVLLSELFKK